MYIVAHKYYHPVLLLSKQRLHIYSNSPNDQEAFTEETQENFKEHVDGGI